MAVRNRLKEILTERGIKSSWLADKVGITKQSMSNLVNNRFSPSVDTALKICIVLNIKFEEVFYWVE